jgi:hypothetical protein
MSQNNISLWLDQKNIVKYPCNKYKNKYTNIELYYTDKEIKKFMHSDINSNLEYADKFCNNNNNNDNNIYINESTRRYEANVLFRKLVDKCAKINLYNTDGMPIINSKNKNSFYNFVFENSKK